MAMNPEVKAQWLAALRSGEWSQGQSKLADNDGNYCCLGVLCELAKAEGKTEAWQYEYRSGGYNMYGNKEAWDGRDSNSANIDQDYTVSWSSIPDNVRDWAGLAKTDPLVRIPLTHPKRVYMERMGQIGEGEESQTNVSQLNDNGWTFDQIADLIENQL